MKKIIKIFFLFLLSVTAGCSDASPPDDAPGNNGDHSNNAGDVVIDTCDEAQNTCLSSNEVLHCVNGVRTREYCPENELCFGGKCGAVVCTPNQIEACRKNGKYYGCNSAGTGMGDFDCDYGLTCIDNTCQARLCEQNSGQCKDEETIYLCNEAGTAYDVEKNCNDILPKSVCDGGKCVPICEQTRKEASYIGCEYWAVDLDNAIDAGTYDAAGQPFAVVLSNTHPSFSAAVQIFTKENNRVVESLAFEIPPGEVKSVFLPDGCYKSKLGGGYISCERAYSTNGSTITDTAFYIKSDLPITAAQFNPLDNVDVFSNDASLLFPTTALGLRYMVMSRQQNYDHFHSFVTVVATQPGQTQVAITSSCKMMSGTDQNGKTIYAMNKGDVQTFTLNQYDVLNLETAALGEDPTGSTVTADKLVAVFAGNEATSLPETTPVTCCADHIEHQQYPLSAWGKNYHAVKLKPRNKERDLWRIMARTDNTVITTTPNVFKSDSITLNAGQWYDLLTRESFTISASAPILLGQFMTGEHDPISPETGTITKDSAGIGDPAYLIGVPIEQYRTDYTFLTPSKYKRDYITIIAPVTASVILDNAPIPDTDFFTFGNGTYKAAYKLVQDGSHTISASERIGLFAYGYDSYVSYGYPAGLDLRELFE